MIITEISLLLATLLLFVLASKTLVDLFVKPTLSEYQISYKKLSGSLLAGITLDEVTINGQPFARRARIDIDLTRLLTGGLFFDEVRIEDLKIDDFKEILKQFKPKKEEKPLFENYGVHELWLSMGNFGYGDLHAQDITIKAKNILYNGKILKISRIEAVCASLEAQKILLNAGVLSASRLETDFNLLNFERALVLAQGFSFGDIHIEGPNLLAQKGIIRLSAIRTSPYVLATSLDASFKKGTYKDFWLLDAKIQAQNATFKDGVYDIKKYEAFFLSPHVQTKTTGSVQKNVIYAKGTGKLQRPFLQKSLPSYLKPEAFLEMGFDGKYDGKRVQANITLSGKDIFRGDLAGYGVNLDKSESRVGYAIDSRILTVDTQAKLSSNVGKLIADNNLTYDKEMRFEGRLRSPDARIFKILGIEGLKEEPFGELQIDYNGNPKTLEARASFDLLDINFSTKDYKTASLSLFSRTFKPNELIAGLPEFLGEIPLNVKSQWIMGLEKPFAAAGSYQLESDLLQTSGTFKKEKTFKLDGSLTIPKESPLATRDQAFHATFLAPASYTLKIAQGALTLNAKSKDTSLSLTYKEGNLDSALDIFGTRILLAGRITPDLDLKVTTFVPSLRELQNQALALYTFSPLGLDGNLRLDATLRGAPDNPGISADIASDWLLYEYAPGKYIVPEKLSLLLEADKNQTTIRNYKVKIGKREFFATKPTLIEYEGPHIVIKQFFVDDQPVLKGSFDKLSKTGAFELLVKNFHYKGPEGDVRFDANLQAQIALAHHFGVEGEIKVLEGEIYYKPQREFAVRDDDIIIIQEKKEPSELVKNMRLNIKVETKKNLLYKTTEANIPFGCDLTLWKEQGGPFELLGLISVQRGSYVGLGKRFTIEPGEIMLGGGREFDPYLNLSGIYKTIDATITVHVTGRLRDPLFSFDSDPLMEQGDILSILLFDSPTSGILKNTDGKNSVQAIGFLGNTFKDEIAKVLGLKLDRLSFITTQDGGIGVEIGKRISRKISILYRNDITNTVVIEYALSPKVDLETELGSKNSSFDVIYKREY